MVQEINRNTSLTVGTALINVSNEIGQNQERKVITLMNISTAGQKITINIGDQAVSGSGIQLNVGGYYHESKDAGFTPTQTFITAVADGAGGTLSVQERVLVR
jgi:hypothetical protein